MVKARKWERTHIEELERLEREGVTLAVLQQAVNLFEDANGYLHSEPRCWGASKVVRADVDELGMMPDPPRCECGGWKGSVQARVLEESGWLHTQIEAETGSTCADIGRWLHVMAQPLFNADLRESHTEAQQRAVAALDELRGKVSALPAIEAVAAQAVRLEVTPEQGPGLRHWANAMMLEATEERRRWLDELFYDRFSEQLGASENKTVLLAARCSYGSVGVLMWATCDEIIERDNWWFGRATLPVMALDGLEVCRSASPHYVEIPETSSQQLWRTAAKLCEVRGNSLELQSAVELATAVLRHGR